MPSDVLTPRHERLLSYWRSLLPPEGGLPARRHFDPVAIPDLLSFLVLADVEGSDLRFRVVGTEMAEAWGSDFTGKTLREIMQGQYHDFIRDQFDACIESRAPVASHSRFQWDRGRWLDTIRVMIPLARNAEPARVGHVVVGQSFHYDRTGPETPSVYSLKEGTLSELSRRVLDVQP
ncbi:MAG: PAS domain-containing protein [Alphaproteobacteria bacterium]|nr:PAS domain-containing protein [Alphaproteobacteria bacterium]